MLVFQIPPAKIPKSHGEAVTDFKNTLTRLNENLNILHEREAKYGGNAPLDLLNQITDHQAAITLTEQAITGELTEVEWREAIRPLLVAMNTRDGEANVSNLTIGDIHGSIIGSEIAGRDISIGQKIVNIFTGGSEAQRDLRNRQIMLQRVYDFWVEGVLENSLYHKMLIELEIEERRESVEYPLDTVIQRPNHSLTPATKIIDIFEKSSGSLLILGESGSGKTIMLLELAKTKIAQAERDSRDPIPTVINLVSWNGKDSFAEWLISELKRLYTIPEKIGRSWIEQDKLLLLLDGLDEVRLEQREACVKAINNFLLDHLVSVVVCARIADYEALTTQLRLQDAVLLKPLSFQQVEMYFETINLPSLQVFARDDTMFRELTTSPLMLHIMTLAYRDKTVQDLKMPGIVEASRKQVFDTYTKAMFKHQSFDQPYSSKQSLYWLAWLAKQISKHALKPFQLENMQPSWLGSSMQRRWYTILYSLTVGLIIGGGFVLPSILTGNLWDGMLYGLFWGCIGGIIASQQEEIQMVDRLQWSWGNLGQLLFSGIMLGLCFGVMLFIMDGLRLLINKLFSQTNGILGFEGSLRVGFFLAFWLLIFVWLLGIEKQLLPEERNIPGQGIHRSAKNGVLTFIVVSLFSSTLGLLSVSLFLPFLNKLLTEDEFGSFDYAFYADFPWLGPLYYLGPILGLVNGGAAFIQHVFLRLVLYQCDYIPSNYVRFLDYSVSRIFLRKVGGGYIFTHNYLMEYFASLTPEDIERLSAEIEPKKAQPA